MKQASEAESMGILEAANGMGKVISPIIGSVVALIIWYALFSYAYCPAHSFASLVFCRRAAGHRREETFRHCCFSVNL